jgi:hypothetical protein
MDAAIKRVNTSKKDNYALDEELRVARARFEETQEDVESRMQTIRNSEESHQT